MSRQAAVLVIIVTTFVFLIVGVVVGHLVATSVARVPSGDTTAQIFMSYFMCSVGGLVAGLGTAAFALWLVGLKSDTPAP